MSDSTSGVTATSTSIGASLGRVKWFNNRKGYGFITVVSEDHKDKDVFVHQTNITPTHSTYRTLCLGEYVSLDVSNDDKEQAVNVTGVLGGSLQCDITKPPLKHRGKSHESGEEHSGKAE